MKKALILGLVGVLTLAGCSTSIEPQPTITVTADAIQPAPAPSNTIEDDFIMYMAVGGAADSFLYGESLDILIDHAKDVCTYIKDGDTKDDIVSYITYGYLNSSADEDVLNAMLAASVAATYTYCPEYKSFWD